MENLIYTNSAPYGGGLSYCSGDILLNLISDNAATVAGGGVYNSWGVFDNNGIFTNTAVSYGGGLASCFSVAFHGNSVSGNEAAYGGGLASCSGDFVSNWIESNIATTDAGGGLWGCTGNVLNNVIANNSAAISGGGVSNAGPLLHNTIYGNDAGVSGGGIDNSWSPIENCIVWGNLSPINPQVSASIDPNYSCIQGWAGGGTGNITTDPMLYAPAEGDFHVSFGSPCINTAFDWTIIDDFDAEARPFGAAPDMGADEFVDTDGDQMPDLWEEGYGLDPAVPNTGDTDGDGLTDYEEYVLRLDPSDEDFDNDGFRDGYEVDRGTDPRDPNSHPDETWMFFSWVGAENGSQLYPFNTVAEAVAATPANGLIKGYPSTSSETPRVTKALRIEAIGGLVKIGG